MNRNAYPFLDGIRGLAAVFVVTRHTWAFWHFELFRSYLAVDVFFLLSGFVIAHAYDAKLGNGTLTRGQFALIRLIRLYPVYALSLCLSAAVALLALVLTGKSTVPVEHLATTFLLAVAFLPAHVAGIYELFPLNGPYWSLFFELIANFVYSVIRPQLTTIKLVSLVAVLWLGTAAFVLRYDNLSFGHTWGTGVVLGGLFRSCYGIFLGLLLFRKKDWLLGLLPGYLKGPAAPWLSFLVIGAILASPSAADLDWLVDIFCSTLVFPVAILLAARSSQTKYQNILTLLGAASYPIYVLHVPLAGLANVLAPGLAAQFAPVSGLLLVALVFVTSLIVESAFDLPCRRWLASKLLRARTDSVASNHARHPPH